MSREVAHHSVFHEFPVPNSEFLIIVQPTNLFAVLSFVNFFYCLENSWKFAIWDWEFRNSRLRHLFISNSWMLSFDNFYFKKQKKILYKKIIWLALIKGYFQNICGSIANLFVAKSIKYSALLIQSKNFAI